MSYHSISPSLWLCDVVHNMVSFYELEDHPLLAIQFTATLHTGDCSSIQNLRVGICHRDGHTYHGMSFELNTSFSERIQTNHQFLHINPLPLTWSLQPHFQAVLPGEYPEGYFAICHQCPPLSQGHLQGSH